MKTQSIDLSGLSSTGESIANLLDISPQDGLAIAFDLVVEQRDLPLDGKQLIQQLFLSGISSKTNGVVGQRRTYRRKSHNGRWQPKDKRALQKVLKKNDFGRISEADVKILARKLKRSDIAIRTQLSVFRSERNEE